MSENELEGNKQAVANEITEYEVYLFVNTFVERKRR